MVHDTRGVSSVLGVALLFGMVIAGMVLVVTVGGAALEEARGGLDTGRAEKAMTQFDSRSAMVALGGTSHQGIDLASGENDNYGVDPESGWMNVTIYNQTADEHTELTNVTLGALLYENGDENIAYQGGGVWQNTPSGVRMLSPPEFHFRAATLTLPIITVNGDRSLGGSAEVTRTGPTTVFYPNESADANFTNPLNSGHVNVTVSSEYYEAWGRYFEQRTDGNVTYDHDRETARVKLVIPFDESYDNVLAATEPGGITMNGNDPNPEPSETGLNYPLADDRIENRIDECESGGCQDLSSNLPIDSGGTYYTDSLFSGHLEVQNPGDDVTIVVNENFQPSDVSITSDHNTTVLVRKSFDIGAALNDDPGAEAGDFSVVLHSDGAFNGNGNWKMVGLLYAPGTDCTFNGGGSTSPNLEGAMVCEEITINGNPNDMEYDNTVADTQLNLAGEITPITYLHVTTNPINVTSG